MTTEAQNSPFIKQLAANDRPTRDKAVESLRTYLASRREMSSLELLKLWKALFYCVWHSDRPLPQQRLVASLTGLVSVIPKSNVLPFLRAFWTTMGLQWPLLDVLRMEKFLLLVRGYVRVGFEWVRDGGWVGERLEGYGQLLGGEEGPLRIKGTVGLMYHVLDVWVDELDRVDEERSSGLTQERLEGVMKPVRELADKSRTKSLRERAKEVLADERLKAWEQGTAEVAKGEELNEEEWGGIEE